MGSLVTAYFVIYSRMLRYEQEKRYIVLVCAGVAKSIAFVILLSLKNEDLAVEMKYGTLLTDLGFYAIVCITAILADTTMRNNNAIELLQWIALGFYTSFVLVLLVVQLSFSAGFLLLPIYSLLALSVLFFVLMLNKQITDEQKTIAQRATISSVLLAVLCLLVYYYAH